MSKRPRISVTERNQQTAAILDDPKYRKGIESPFGLPSQGIELKDPGWYCRWINDELMGGGNVWRKKNEAGYENVKPEDFRHPEQAKAFNVDASGNICMGSRGQIQLMKIPAVVAQARAMAKTERNYREMRDWTKEKQGLVEAVGAKFGSEAADYVDQHGQGGPFGGVKTYGERIEVREDGE